MTLFIGHSSALRLFRSLEKPESLRPTQANPLSKGVPHLPEKPKCNSALTMLPAPLDVVVASEKDRSQSKQFSNHIWQLPDKVSSFLFLDKGIYLSTPEFCFAQLARECNAIELMKLGFELCGTYRLDRKSPIGFRNAQPLTSPGAITRFLEKLPSRTPTAANTALKFIRADSASPMETCLALLLGLPTRYGGYGLGVPTMNSETFISTRQGKRVTHNRYHCDLFWPEQRVAVEYNSREFHINEQAIERDASRINDLKAAGIEVVAVTRAHVANPDTFDAVAHTVARLLRKRVRTSCADVNARRVELRRQLFAKDSWS